MRSIPFPRNLTLPSRTLLTLGVLLALAAALVACGGDAAAPGTPGTIHITGNDLMQFSATELTVAAGSNVTLTFENVGSMPKEAMGHNLAILHLGTDAIEFARAAIRHPANEYIAPEMSDRVIAATAILGPGEQQTITFTAPSEPGDYDFVCSFPGHTEAGMRGIMRVR